MINKLEPIILQKKCEVADLYQRLQQEHLIAKIMQGEYEPKQIPRFKEILRADLLTVIAEIKRKSPSKGSLATIVNPVDLAKCYIAGGASAISILTDQTFFSGHLNDLIAVTEITHQQNIPVLRKDFIIDKIQIAEAAVAGASAILLIVAVLGKKMQALLEFARSIHLDVLVEIHDHAELQIALDCGAEIIGVNNRNLKTFAVDTQQALQLVAAIPDNILKVAESGITDPLLAREYDAAGFDAVLIGESLVKSANPESFIQACRYD